jgi:outer membrane autotransporter protein
LDRSIGGIVAGLDGRFAGMWRAGIAGGYARSNANIDSRDSAADVTGGQIMGYVGTEAGPWAIRLGAANSWNRYDTRRDISFTGFSETARAHYSGITSQAFGEVGYGLTMQNVAVEPFGGLAWVHLGTDAFTEKGSTLALDSPSTDRDVEYSTLGIRFGSAMAPNDTMTVTPHGSIAWQHAFGTIAADSTFHFAGGSSAFTIAGVPLSQDSALIDAGLDVHAAAGIVIGLSYSGQIGTNLEDHGIKGNFVWSF